MCKCLKCICSSVKTLVCCLCWSVFVLLLLGFIIALLVIQPWNSESAADNVRVDLDGRWQAEVKDDSGRRLHRCTMPGTMHTALISADEIHDPYYRFNDVEYRHVCDNNLTISRSVTVDSLLAEKNSVLLICEGIDTVTSVYFNGKHVGNTNNQFVRYIFDVTDSVKEGSNEIAFNFASNVEYARRQADQYEADHGYKVPPECPPDEYHPECNANFIRKSQSSFGSAWGPAFPTQGIWNHLFLEGYSRGRIKDVMAWPFKETPHDMDSTWKLNTTVVLQVHDDSDDSDDYLHLPNDDELVIEIKELGIRQEIDLKEDPLKDGENVLSVIVDATDAETWWPAGYGDQPMYSLQVEFTSLKYMEKSTETKKIGFRTVEVVEDDIGTNPDTTGYTFYFKINEVPIFLKGANWIPVDSFSDRATPYRLRKLLEAAIWANMNTIRVWGGGLYEDDALYEFADEKGLLVWQDFMFATSMYPVDDVFLETVEDEIRYQVRRLMHHPSVIMWTGNSENELAIVDNRFDTEPNRAQYEGDYTKLYVDVMGKVIKDEDPSRYYLVSTPSNGRKVDEVGLFSDDPSPDDHRYGTVHYYNYDDDCWDHTIYPKPRFVAEYGYQSMPSFQTLKRVSIEEDWVYDSPFMTHRQHSAEAGLAMENLMKRHFRLPDVGDSTQVFKDKLYLSQISQSLCYKVQTEHYRRSQSDEEAKTMGSLFWQLNSIWQAPSWSSIEFGERYKMLHYFARRFFAPLIISPYEEGGFLHVDCVSDHTEAFHSLELDISMWKWDGDFEPLRSWREEFSQEPQTSELVYSKAIDEMLNEAGCNARKDCFLTFDLVNLNSTTLEEAAPRTEFYLSSFNEVDGMKTPDVKITDIVNVDEGAGSVGTLFDVNITASAVAAFTWLETLDITGHFSDNGFLMTEPHKVVRFTAWHPLELDYLRDHIKVHTLRDIYID
ncbi:beta-mannosidase-like [Ptychodera flava]|uniref:beta-mannosidase-like n=1 Tax=Ptychodera flava TaxID=63121 RepID=UPI003969D1B3